MNITDEEINELERALRPKLTDDFLATLAEAVIAYGDSGDSVETYGFARAMYTLVDKEPPEKLNDR